MRVLSLALGGLLLFGAATTVEAQTPRIGYIDSQAILAEAPGSREAQQAFDREMDRYRGEMQRLGEELDRLITAYQQQERNLTPEAREAREQEIRRKEMEYQGRIEEIDQEANGSARNWWSPSSSRCPWSSNRSGKRGAMP
jgi:Skp family chaperone for outer membrane proteins